MSSLNDDRKGRPSPTYWRSLAEREGAPEFRDLAEREFATPTEALPPNDPGRRRFMQIMGAGTALATAAGCRWQEDKLLPMASSSPERIPGETKRYATAMDIAGATVGMHATSYDGRPIKLEGNPAHPDSLGALGVLHQAAVLELYDPDRSRSPAQGTTDKTWDEFLAAAKAVFDSAKAGGGASLRVLSERSSSASLAALKAKLAATYPQSKWVEWEPAVGDGERAGTMLAFGKPYRTHFDLSVADVVVALDADFIDEAYPAGLANARALMARRDPDGKMNRIYAVESGLSQVGSIADHRLALRSELVKAFAAALDAAVSAAAGSSGAQPKPSSAALADAKVAKFIEALAKDLVAAKGRSLVVAGPRQPAEVHALAARLNSILGNAGKSVTYSADTDDAAESPLARMETLVGEMNAGLDALLILGGNPVYTVPADLGFGDALGKVKTSIHVSSYRDETSRRATWHVNRAHFLETWGDVTAHDGALSIQQPLIAPLWQGRSPIEVLSALLGSADGGFEIVKKTHQATLGDERKLKRAIHDGVVNGVKREKATPELKELAPLPLSERENGGPNVGNGQLELVLSPCNKVHDGRYGNLSWLQELPDSFTKLAWDNAAAMSPATAKALGVTDGQHATLTLGGKSITVPVVVLPGVAEGSIHVALGYGRTAAGRVGGDEAQGVVPVGANATALRSKALLFFGGGLTVTATAKTERLAMSQDAHSIDQVGREGADARLGMLVREATLEQYGKEPEFAKHAVHHPPLLNLWQAPVSYDGHKWGMSIDLAKCMGCSACITACQAENNIASVGKEQMAMGRELLWLRVDRYFRGTPEAPEVAWQPLPCMQCENAPCEQVCPVGATMHSSEGLNDMTYNRCIGTRYCANNCPYKVRRFNYLNNHLDKQGHTPWHGYKDEDARVKAMVYNPEVTLRSRGVMEKCTFCVQRIQNAKIPAKNQKRALKDGEIKTACQQTCPTGAIVFGDLNDGGSEVKKQSDHARSYGLLEELNNRPRVRYLARVKNPNPELS